MKRYTIIMAIVAALLIPCLMFAAGTVTQSYAPVYSSEGNTNMATLSFAWTTDSSESATATTNTTISDQIAGKYVTAAITDPDAADAPAASYDIVVTDANGVDIMGGKLADRSATATEQARPYIGSDCAPRPVAGALTLTVTSAGSGKSGITILYLSR